MTSRLNRATILSMFRSVGCIGVLTVVSSLTLAQPPNEPAYYSTGPHLRDALVRDVAYVNASEAQLLKWAKVMPRPKAAKQAQTIHVRVQVEGEEVFCAQAVDGPP